MVSSPGRSPRSSAPPRRGSGRLCRHSGDVLGRGLVLADLDAQLAVADDRVYLDSAAVSPPRDAQIDAGVADTQATDRHLREPGRLARTTHREAMGARIGLETEQAQQRMWERTGRPRLRAARDRIADGLMRRCLAREAAEQLGQPEGTELGGRLEERIEYPQRGGVPPRTTGSPPSRRSV
jgi:hypothetical protein